MSYRKVNDNSLASVADAIRSKGGTSDTLVFPDGFVSAISAIQTGGGGGEVSTGYRVTFPATANNWDKVDTYAKLVFSNGSTVDFKDYSVVAGRTIKHVIGIQSNGYPYYALRLTLAAGTIVLSRAAGGGADLYAYRIKAPGTTPTEYATHGMYYWFMPVEDIIISAIDMEYTYE